MERNAMSGPDELEMSAAVKLADCVPLAIAVEALKRKAEGVQTRLEDENQSLMSFSAAFLIGMSPTDLYKNSNGDDLCWGCNDCICGYVSREIISF